MRWNPFKRSKPELSARKVTVTVTDAKATILYRSPDTEEPIEVPCTFLGSLYACSIIGKVWAEESGRAKMLDWLHRCDTYRGAPERSCVAPEPIVSDLSYVLMSSRVLGCTQFVEVDRRAEIDLEPGYTIAPRLLRAEREGAEP